jgi:hypothetical protein
MKLNIIFYIISIFLVACAKDDIINIEPIKPIEIILTDTSNIKTGRYRGEMWLYLPDRDTIYNFSYREIYRDKKGYLIMRWWSHPDTTSKMKDADTLKYKMTYDNTNTSCGIQRSIYIYMSKSYMNEDTLIEFGTVEHKFYYQYNMIKHIFGHWSSESIYVDKLTPMKPKP